MSNLIVKWTGKDDAKREYLANHAHISYELVIILENGGVTHPKIAQRIGGVIGLTELEQEELMPEHLRKHSPHYDPYKHVIKKDRIIAKVNDLIRDKSDVFTFEQVSDALEVNLGTIQHLIDTGKLIQIGENTVTAKDTKKFFRQEKAKIMLNGCYFYSKEETKKLMEALYVHV